MVIFCLLVLRALFKKSFYVIVEDPIQSIAAYAIIDMALALLLNLSDIYSKWTQNNAVVVQ